MKIWPLLVSLTLVTSVNAQTPYAGMQARPIKALSDQQIADLKAGRGMGLALAAELNGYPGPLHVLELADKLDLSTEQRTGVQRLFDQMKAEAMPLGSRLIEQETDLDRQFANRTVTPESLKTSIAAVATTQGELAGNPPEISSLDRRHPQPIANAQICRIARLWRRSSAPSLAVLPLPGGLYPARQTDMVRN